jgi:hypothetical protein
MGRFSARHTEREINKKYIFAAGLAIARDVRAESGEGFKPFQAAYNVAPGGSVSISSLGVAGACWLQRQE